MNKIIKKKWLNALRSGKYTQGKQHLKCNGAYCCLGVLCKITGNEHNTDMQEGFPRISDNCDILPFIGLTESMQKTLAELNDGGCSFEEIANYISKHVKGE